MRLALLLFILFSAFVSKATHLRSGQITLSRVSTLTYTVTIKVYTNLGSEIRFGDFLLDFGDGSNPQIIPATENTPRPDLGVGVGVASYSIDHTFPAFGSYLVSYLEPNLSADIINIQNSVETKFYLESRIVIGPIMDSSSPEFLTEPIFRHHIGKIYSFSTAAVDKNGYQLAFQMVNPLKPGSANFSMPENISVNSYNGLITWDTKYKGEYLVGQYYLAVRVTQYDSNNEEIGYVTRAFQVILEDGDLDISIVNPVNDTNNRIYLEENKERTIKVPLVSNKATNNINWEVYHDKIIDNNFSFSQYDSISGSNKVKVAVIKLSSTSDIIRNSPYMITLRGSSIFQSETSVKDINYLLFTRDVLPAIVTQTTGYEKIKIKVYPNPFSDFLIIELNSFESLNQIYLMNSSGQVLDNLQQRNGSLETSHLPPGMYILQTGTDSKLFRQKVLKK